MNLQRCTIGHYYDADKYLNCPHCSKNNENHEMTVKVNNIEKYETVSEKKEDVIIADSLKNVENKVYVEDDDRTVSVTSFFNGNSEEIKEPVTGWLVCVEGEDFGKSFELRTGRNHIGRSQESDICINDNAISRLKHAIIVFEPRKKIFIAQPGDSKELYYINDDVVLNNIILDSGAILLIGYSKFIFIPLCSDKFNWEDYRKCL